MKPSISRILLVLGAIAIASSTSYADNKEMAKDVKDKAMVVKAACGECLFGMEGESCDLAVMINDKPYFVKGTTIDDHGDAHAADGLCNAVRMAKVKGEVKDGVFVATSFKLVDQPSKKMAKEKEKKG